MIRKGFNPAEYIEKVSGWIRQQVEGAGCDGVILGLSGGIDSAVVAGLCERVFPKKKRYGVIMPCWSHPGDEADALLVAARFDVTLFKADLTDAFNKLVAAVTPTSAEIPTLAPPNLAQGNLKARMRMSTLYLIANSRNLMVLGTGNLDEITVGYFTKYGDGGADILPLAELTKGEVRAVATELGVPQPVIDKAPSAGLWPGQTDEKEMGITYEELDYFCLDRVEAREVNPEVYKQAVRREEFSAHKRRLPPSPRFLV